jgi:transposase
MLASLVATCKLNGVNPLNYIHQTLRAILDGHPRNQIEQLMPWTYDQASSLAA